MIALKLFPHNDVVIFIDNDDGDKSLVYRKGEYLDKMSNPILYRCSLRRAVIFHGKAESCKHWSDTGVGVHGGHT